MPDRSVTLHHIHGARVFAPTCLISLSSKRDIYDLRLSNRRYMKEKGG